MIAHRWAGLTLAVFLTIAGVTGAIIPFEETLGYASRPGVSKVQPPSAGAATLDAVTIAERVERQSGGTIFYLPLEVPRTHPMRIFVGPKPGGKALGYDTVWADPYTGRVLLTFTWGGMRDGAENIVPFLFQLHYGYVAGPWGMWTFGVAALIWTIDCFVGFGLTLPALRSRSGTGGVKGWWSRWKPAWRMRRARGYKRTFDLHRVSGLWLWPMLLVFAWSGVALALPTVSDPVMHLFGASETFQPKPRPAPLPSPPIGRREAIALGMRDLRHIGAARGFAVERQVMLGYDSSSGTYTLSARTSLDAQSEGGRTLLSIDATDGRVVHFADPIGARGADRLMTWLTMLHMAEVFGLPYKIITALIGLAVATLSVTGVLIWQRKRGARRAAPRRAAQRA